MPKLTHHQIGTRIKAMESFLEKRFPGMAFCLAVSQEAVPGLQDMSAAFNVPAPQMRAMLQSFAHHHAENERRLNNPEGNA